MADGYSSGQIIRRSLMSIKTAGIVFRANYRHCLLKVFNLGIQYFCPL